MKTTVLIVEEYGYRYYLWDFFGNKKDLIKEYEKGDLYILSPCCCIGGSTINWKKAHNIRLLDSDADGMTADARLYIEGDDCMIVNDKRYHTKQIS